MFYLFLFLLTYSPFSKLSPTEAIENNRLAFSVAEEHLGVNKLLKPEEMSRPDKLTLFTYLSLIYELFINAEPAEEMSMEITSPPESVTPPSLDTSSRESSPMDEETGKSSKKSRISSFSRLSKKLLRRRTSKTRLGVSPSSAERSWNTKSVKRPTMSPPTSPISPSSLKTVLEVR